ncbi:MAG TPA: nuclear transport factor 2 family protein [Vicinamibacterales bacterium]
MPFPALLSASLILLSIAGAQASEEAGVRAALNHYLQGHATGDPAHMRKAFLPTAHIEGIRDGRFVSWTLDEYCALFNGRPAPDEATRRRTIDQIDINGTAAMARATLVHGPTTFTDYFVLLKVDGEWRIANKVYTMRSAERGVRSGVECGTRNAELEC